MSDNFLMTGFERLKEVLVGLLNGTIVWLQDRSDGEQLIMATFFILLLMTLIVRMSMRREDGVARNFIGALCMVVVFAFGLGWMIDSRFGPAAMNIFS